MTPEERQAIIEAVPENWADKVYGYGDEKLLSARRAVESKIRSIRAQFPQQGDKWVHLDSGYLRRRLDDWEQFARWLDGVDNPEDELK